jgi:hypothetical protein
LMATEALAIPAKQLEVVQALMITIPVDRAQA